MFTLDVALLEVSTALCTYVLVNTLIQNLTAFVGFQNRIIKRMCFLAGITRPRFRGRYVSKYVTCPKQIKLSIWFKSHRPGGFEKCWKLSWMTHLNQFWQAHCAEWKLYHKWGSRGWLGANRNVSIWKTSYKILDKLQQDKWSDEWIDLMSFLWPQLKIKF